jgi:hypothetical protein
MPRMGAQKYRRDKECPPTWMEVFEKRMNV